MIFAQIFCVIMILAGVSISIKGFKIMNTMRIIFNQDELGKDDFRVFFYRVSGIGVAIVFALFLFQTLSC